MALPRVGEHRPGYTVEVRWYLNPITIRDRVRDACRIRAGGGPRTLRLNGVGKPDGWILPTSTLGLEVIARDGTRTGFEPELPVPLPLAYGYRLGRALGLPLLAEVEPERITVAIGGDGIAFGGGDDSGRGSGDRAGRFSEGSRPAGPRR